MGRFRDKDSNHLFLSFPKCTKYKMEAILITTGVKDSTNSYLHLWVIIIFLFILLCLVIFFWHIDKREKLKLKQNNQQLHGWEIIHQYFIKNSPESLKTQKNNMIEVR